MAGMFYNDIVVNRLKINFKLFFIEKYHVYYFNHSSTPYLNVYGYRRSPPPTHTFLESKHQAR